MSWRAAVKLAYDGRDFFGSQRQPGVPTVEDEVIRSLRKIKAIRDPDEARFRAASRTDRGVSALGNVVAFDTVFRPAQLLRALNSASGTVHFYAWAEVPSTFSPRKAVSRWYRYFLPSAGLDPAQVRSCAAEFQGQHDFQRFCKRDGRPTVKVLDRVEALPIGDFLVIDLEAREFLRNMVRRIVAALQEVGAGRMGEEEVRRALAGDDIQFGLVPPENLMLMDVRYGFDFKQGEVGDLWSRAEAGSRDAMVRLAFYDELLSRLV